MSSSQMAGVLFGTLVAVLICLAIRSKCRDAKVWRDGHATLHGNADFAAIEPPRKYVHKPALLGRLTRQELLEIGCKSIESRNLLVGPKPSPLELANLPQVARLAIVEVPRLLEHIRRLEERT